MGWPFKRSETHGETKTKDQEGESRQATGQCESAQVEAEGPEDVELRSEAGHDQLPPPSLLEGSRHKCLSVSIARRLRTSFFVTVASNYLNPVVNGRTNPVRPEHAKRVEDTDWRRCGSVCSSRAEANVPRTP